MASWDDVITYEQLQALTPEDRREHFRASTNTVPEREREHVKALSARLDARTREREEHLRGQAS
jgi:hypothetical protein